MSDKKYCPILYLAHEAPKNGTYDPRTCKSDCAWFDSEEKECILHSIKHNLIELIEYTCASTYMEDDYDL